MRAAARLQPKKTHKRPGDYTGTLVRRM